MGTTHLLRVRVGPVRCPAERSGGSIYFVQRNSNYTSTQRILELEQYVN